MAGSASAVQATVTTSVRASKTWVLPPRAKPGRKSKKDLAAAAAAAPAASEDAAEDDADYDKTSSRTKQKASRERKQEYIAELEAKVRTYEQGDGERASFFQELAKRYSEERDALKKENEELRARILVLESSIPQSSIPPALHRASSSSDGTTSRPSRPKRQKTRADSISSAASSSAGSCTLSFASTARPPLQRASIPASRPAAATAAAAGPSPSPSLSPQLRIIPAQDANASGSVRYRYPDASSLAPSAAAYYIPPSPPVSSDLSPGVRSETALPPVPFPAHAQASPQHTHRSGCGLCDETSSSQCICQELGIAGGQSCGIGGAGADSAPPAAHLAAADNTSCGMCDETASESCICKEMGLRSGSDAATSSAPSLAAHTPNIPAGANRQRDTLSMSAVPLRLAKRKRSNSQSSGNSRPVIWRIDNAGAHTPLPVPAQPVQSSGPRTSPAAGVALRRRLIKVGSRLPCSGDPKTCLACADDPAGQAFCSALSSTVCSTTPCANCPNRPSPLANEVKMRSSPAVSDSTGTTAISLLAASSSPLLAPEAYLLSSAPGETQTETELKVCRMRQDLRRRDSSTRDEVPDAMVPCSDAWATLRAHPNIGFANLDLLASVVAKRTHCTASERRDAEGKVIEIGREGVEEGLEFLDHVRD